jgi:mannose-6-phosphate isomerase
MGSDMKVDKPWGHEIRWAITNKYLGKLLRIEAGHRLSRQYHEQKEESIYVLNGTLVLELGEGDSFEKVIISEGGTWHITPGTIHRFCAPSGGCTLIEVSTPEIDDVVRLQDDYGR